VDNRLRRCVRAADARRGGGYVEVPGQVELMRMLEDLNSTDNTFFVVYPDDKTPDWSISVHTRSGGLGGDEGERRDAAIGQHETSTDIDHITIVTEVLTRIRQRRPVPKQALALWVQWGRSGGGCERSRPTGWSGRRFDRLAVVATAPRCEMTVS